MTRKEFLNEFGGSSKKYNELKEKLFSTLPQSLPEVKKFTTLFNEIEGNKDVSEERVDIIFRDLNDMYEEICQR